MEKINTYRTPALGFELFPFPILSKQIVVVKNTEQIDADPDLSSRLQSGLSGISATNYATPITLSAVGEESNEYFFPCDPILSISGKNIIIRRKVSKSKMRGTIKERWSQDDYDITIAGMLVGASPDNLKSMQRELVTMLENGKNGFNIKCDILNNYLDVQRIAIEAWDFPPTPGLENQAFSIKAYSDDIYTLFEEIV